MLDLLIIGGGPVGIATALEAKKKNLNYIVIEKGVLVNSIFHFPAYMRFFSTSEKLEIDNIPFTSINPKPTRSEGLEYYRKVAYNNDLKINLFEKVETIEKVENHYKVETSKGAYSTKNITVATGFYGIPNYINVPGEDLPKVSHYYNDPHYYYMQKTIVVGASNSAADAALEIYRKGGEVTMVVRGDDIGERVKYWVRPDIKNRIAEGSIRAFYNANVVEIRENEVDIKLQNGEIKTLENDHVLILTGYRPNYAFLKKLGIKISQDAKKIPHYDIETMETNQEGIYLAGVICAGEETHNLLIENSLIHAKKIVKHISGQIKKQNLQKT
ncbi:MAG TPA: YpdA family putative bacillithiol disulfide reductase [Flavobacteriaceae bacterium]|nr:YpdA family putative bacillithiol disulfide reductase [Flavobacteriaceae bacterium]